MSSIPLKILRNDLKRSRLFSTLKLKCKRKKETSRVTSVGYYQSKQKSRMVSSTVFLFMLLQPMSASSVLRPSTMALLRIHVEITQELHPQLNENCIPFDLGAPNKNATDEWSIIVFDSTSSEDTNTFPIMHRKTLQLFSSQQPTDNSTNTRHAIVHLPIPRPTCILSQEQKNNLPKKTLSHPIHCEQVIVAALYKTKTIATMDVSDDSQNVTQAVKRIVHTISHDTLESSSLEPIRIDLHHQETTSHHDENNNEKQSFCRKQHYGTNTIKEDTILYLWYTLIACLFIIYKYLCRQSHLDWTSFNDHFANFIECVHDCITSFNRLNNDSNSNEECSITSHASYNQSIIPSRACRSCHESRADSWMDKSDWKRPIDHEDDDSDDGGSMVGNTIPRAPTTIRKYWRSTIDHSFDDETYGRGMSHRTCDLLFERGSMMNYRELPSCSNPLDKGLSNGTSRYFVAKRTETQDIFGGNTLNLPLETEKHNDMDDSHHDKLQIVTMNTSMVDLDSPTKNDELSKKSTQNVSASKQVQWSDEMSYSGEHDPNQVDMTLESTSNNSSETQEFNNGTLMTDKNAIRTLSPKERTVTKKLKQNIYEEKPSSVVFDLVIVDSASDDAQSISSSYISQKLTSENNQNEMTQVAKGQCSDELFDDTHRDETHSSKRKNDDENLLDGPSRLQCNVKEDEFEFENNSATSIISRNETIKISPVKQKKVFKAPSIRSFKPSVGLFHASKKFSAPVWEHSIASSHDKRNVEGGAKKESLQRQRKHQRHYRKSSKSSHKTSSTVSESKTHTTSTNSKKKDKHVSIRKKPRRRQDSIPTSIEIKINNEKALSLARHAPAVLKRKRKSDDPTSDDSETSSKRSRVY